MYRNTPQAAKEVPCSVPQLVLLIQRGYMVPPEKGPGGAYAWTAADIRRAREARKLVKNGRPKVEVTEQQ